MLNLAKIVKPWREAGALNANLNLYGFWDDHTFITKSGELGLIQRASGIDYESLDSRQRDHAVSRVEAAMKPFDRGFHVYQYLFKQNRPEIPFAEYDNPVIDMAVAQRRGYFERKRDKLFQIEIFYAVVLEGPRSKGGLLAAMSRFPSDPRGALRELKAQFSSDQTKVLLRQQIESDLAKLHARARTFRRHLADLMTVELLTQDEQFAVLRRLMNFDASSIAGRPRSGQFLDYQVANSNVEAERDHLRVGSHYVRLLTMKEAIDETRPLVLDKLIKIESNFHVVTEWTAVPTDKVRNEIKGKRRHFNASKGSSTSGEKGQLQRDQLIDESQQADIEDLGECLKLLGDGHTMGDFSLTVVLHGRDLTTLDRDAGEFMSLFTEHDGALLAETYNQLNAFFATVPGNYAHNLRKLYLLDSNYADLSFLFTIHEGEKRNTHLDAEYLAVLETDNATPYFLNLHDGGIAHTLILGKTGSGKSFFLCFLLLCLQKYRPFCTIFDVGNSFQSLTQILGGTYLNVGQESQDFTINPFSLAPTPDNLEFLFQFFQVLIEGRDRRHPLDTKGERTLWEGVENMYTVPVEQRTVSTLAALIGHPLSDRLHRWTRAGGQYGFLFDNVHDTLHFSHFQTFNFAGWGEESAAMEPLLFYILHRTSQEITDPAKLAMFKVFLIDEFGSFIENPTILRYVKRAEETWRKHNAAMILAAQSQKQVEDSGMLPIVAESCPTKIFLFNPALNKKVYAEAFHLNDTEMKLLAGLLPHGEMLVRKERGSKKLRLNVDSVSYWMATNNAPDNLKKQEYFARHGVAEGLRRLAEDFPRERGAARPALPEPRAQSRAARTLTLAN